MLKAYIEGNYIHVNVTLKINETVLCDKGNVGGLEIFNQGHPFEEMYESMPDLVKESIYFVLNEGENTWELEFENRMDPIEFPFRISLVPVNSDTPAFEFESMEQSGNAHGIFQLVSSSP